MNIFIVLLTILFTSAIGYILIRGFNLIEDKLFAFSCSYGLGMGLVSFQLYLYSRLNIPWENTLLIIPWILIGGITIIKNKERFIFNRPKVSRLNKFEYILIASIGFAVFYTVFEAIIRPATTWDSWATWLVESKAFFIEGRINPDILAYLTSDYPLLLKLHWTFIYNILSKVDDTAVLLTSSAFYIFLLLGFYSSLRKRFNLKYVLLFTFLMATIQVFIRQGGRLEAGQADLPLAYFSFISVVLFLDYIKNRSGKTFFLLNIFLIFTSLIKLEGIPFAIVVEVIAAYRIYKTKLYKHLFMILVWILLIIEWRFFRLSNHLESYYIAAHPIEISFDKTINAIHGTTKNLINVKSWNLLWIVYFYTLFAFGLKKTKELGILNFIVISQLIVYLASYLFTFGNAPNSSIERLLVHVAPIVFYYIAVQPEAFSYGFLKRLNLLNNKNKSS